MNKQCAGCSLIFWLPVLCLALGPTASAVDDEAAALEMPALESPAAPPSSAASLIPANTPPTLKALGGELILVWGGEDALTAASEDTTVATASVDGTIIVVTGVSAGDTEIVVQAGSEEFHVPVQVGS